MTSNSNAVINHIAYTLKNVIYILDDRSIHTWPTVLEKILFDDAEDLYGKIRNISTDSDLYNSRNKKLIQDLYTFFDESVRVDVSKYYPSYLLFTKNDINDFEDVCFELERIMRFDYQRLKDDNKELYNELNRVVLHPARIEKVSSQYGIGFFDYLDAINV